MKAAVVCLFFAAAAVAVTSCPSWRLSAHSAAIFPGEIRISGEPASPGAREQAYGYYGSACMQMLEARAFEADGKTSQADQAWRSAAQSLEKAAQKDPGSVDVRRALAGCYMRLGEAEKATETIRKLEAISADSPQAHIEIAEAFKSLNKNQEALAAYEQAVKAAAPGSDAWFAAMDGMARLYRALGMPAKAAPLLQQMVKITPRDPSLQLDLAFVLGDCGKHDEAIATALPLLEGASKLDAGSLVRAHFFLAGEYEKASRIREGVQEFADLAKAQPDSPEICQSRMQLLEAAGQVKEALSLGSDFLAKHKDADAIRLITAGLFERDGRPERAMELYREGVGEGEPFRSIAARQLLLMAMRLGEGQKSDLALQGLQIVFSANEVDDALRAQARLQGAMIYRQKGQAEKAIELLKPLITTEEKRNWRVGLLYADFLRATGETAEAVKYLEGMLAGHANEPEAVEGIHFSWALIYQTPGATDSGKAEEHLRAALAANPGSPSAANGLGYLFAQQGRDLDEAEKLLDMALRKLPKEPAFLDTLGWIYYKQALRDNDMGRVRKAIEQLQLAADAAKDAIVYDHLGDAAFVAGDWEKAKQYWDKALVTPVEPGGEQIGRAFVQRKLAMVTNQLADEFKQFGKARANEDRIVRPLSPPAPPREAPK